MSIRTPKLFNLAVIFTIALGLTLGSIGDAEARSQKRRRSRKAKSAVTKVVRHTARHHRKARRPKRVVKVRRHVRTRPRHSKRVVHVHTPARRRRPARKVVVVHTPPRRPRRVVHVHRTPPLPPRRVVHVYAGGSTETAPPPEPANPAVRGYLGAGLMAFGPTVADAALDPGNSSGVHVFGGLLFDDRVALELGWAGTMAPEGAMLQAGTLDVKVYLDDGEVRPYFQAGAGIYGLDMGGATSGVATGAGTTGGSLTGPGVQLGGGLELGNGPLTVNLGATWRAAALDSIGGPITAEPLAQLQGVALTAGVTIRF